MNSSVEDSVFDFDLNFLHPTPENTVSNVPEKRKSLYMVKKKTISADILIRDFYAKKEALEQTEKELYAAKEECKQTCIEYKRCQDACAQLEKQLQLLRNRDKERETSNITLENQLAAANSHVHQLQTLVKQQETIIDSLKIENKLSKPNVKDSEKKAQTLQKECDTLRRHICLAKSIIFGKTKVTSKHRSLLKKYDKYDSQNKDDAIFEEESNDEYTSDDIPLSPFSEDYVDEAELSKISKISNSNVKRIESNNIDQMQMRNNSVTDCNDVSSIDTGRGSSRACSGSDKCFRSPDYFNDDNILCDVSALDKIRIKLVASATSPIPGPVTVNVSTSPINFNHPVIDRAVSPIIVLSTTYKKDAIVKTCDRNNVVSVSIHRDNATERSQNVDKTMDFDKNQKQKECLEINNSQNICNERTHDHEIEMILNTMRLHRMITPIPTTPSKSNSESKMNTHRKPHKRKDYLDNICENTAEYHKKPPDMKQKSTDQHIIKLDDRVLIVLNKDGTYVMFDNKRPITLPSNDVSFERLRKYIPIAISNDNGPTALQDDNGLNKVAHTSNPNDNCSDNVIVKPNSYSRVMNESNDSVQAINSHSTFVMEKNSQYIAMSDLQTRDIQNKIFVESLNHDETTLMAQNSGPMVRDKRYGFIERLSDDQHALSDNDGNEVSETPYINEPMAVDNEYQPNVTHTVNKQITSDENNETNVTPINNKLMTADNECEFTGTQSDDKRMEESNETTVLHNNYEPMTIGNEYEPLRIRTEHTISDTDNIIISPTIPPITVDNTHKGLNLNRSTVTFKGNDISAKSNDHETVTDCNKYRLFEDLCDDGSVVTFNDNEDVFSPNKEEITTIDSKIGQNEYSNNVPIVTLKPDMIIKSPEHGITTISDNHGRSEKKNDDGPSVADKVDVILVSPDNNTNMTVDNNYGLFEYSNENPITTDKDNKYIVSIAHETAIDNDNYSCVDNLSDDSRMTYKNDELIVSSQNDVSDTIGNHYGRFEVSSEGAIVTAKDDEVVVSANDNETNVDSNINGFSEVSHNIPTVIVTTISNRTRIDSINCGLSEVSDNSPAVTDKDDETIILPNTNRTTFNTDSCGVSEVSDNGPVVTDKDEKTTEPPHNNKTTIEHKNYGISEVADNDPMISDEDDETIVTANNSDATIDTNSYGLSEICDNGHYVTNKDVKTIVPPHNNKTTTESKNCRLFEFTDDDTIVTDADDETIASPKNSADTIDTNSYGLSEICGNGHYVTDKDEKTIVPPHNNKTTTESKNYSLFEFTDDDTIVTDADDETIASPNNSADTIDTNSYGLSEICDNDRVVSDKDKETIVPPHKTKTTTESKNYGLSQVTDDDTIVTDADDETIASPNNNADTIDINSYGLSKVSDNSQVIIDKDDKTVVLSVSTKATIETKNNGLSEVHDVDAMVTDADDETIVSLNNNADTIDINSYGLSKVSDNSQVVIDKDDKTVVLSVSTKATVETKNNGLSEVHDVDAMVTDADYETIVSLNNNAAIVDTNNYGHSELCINGSVINKEDEIIVPPNQANNSDMKFDDTKSLSGDKHIITGTDNEIPRIQSYFETTTVTKYCDLALSDDEPGVMKNDNEIVLNLNNPESMYESYEDREALIKGGNEIIRNNELIASDTDYGAIIKPNNEETSTVNNICVTSFLNIASPNYQETRVFGKKNKITKSIRHEGANLTNTEMETTIKPNVVEPVKVNNTNSVVTLNESDNKETINKSRVPANSTQVFNNNSKNKKRSLKSKFKSLFDDGEDLLDNDIEQSHVNSAQNIDKNVSILLSEEIAARVIENDIFCNVNSESIRNKETTTSSVSTDCISGSKTEECKLVRTKKTTKLGKLRQKLLPRPKIKSVDVPLKRIVNVKEIINSNKKITVTEADSSATLNNKDAYEKAVQVIRELRRKKSISVNSNDKQSPKISEKISYKPENLEKNTPEERNLIHNQTTSNEINTRSRRRSSTQTPPSRSPIVSSDNNSLKNIDTIQSCVIEKDLTKSPKSRRHLKRTSVDIPPSEIPCKRLLRNTISDNCIEKEPMVVLHRFDNTEAYTSGSNIGNNISQTNSVSPKTIKSPGKKDRNFTDKSLREVTTNVTDLQKDIANGGNISDNPRNSVLCQMIQRYGVKAVKKGKKVPETTVASTAKKIEDGISRIIELPVHETKDAMNKFVGEILNWDMKHFLAGLTKYLKDPQRRNEMYSKVVLATAPALTKAEQVILYVVSELKLRLHPVDIVDKILNCMEYTLFALNRTPQFDVIESVSHLYAVICRYFKMKTRLRLFILDAMYCMQFKAVPLIRQCVEVWMHILPLAHMPSAKIPLVTCMVYLLHFYKCEDRLNRVQELRNLLQRKYFYNITEWNEIQILELFKNSITSLRGIQTEVKMLRIALIILAKRQGPRWCQNTIVKNLLQPIIEMKSSSELVKAFCLSMLGPLLKPYPADMKVHCEIVMNQLITMLQENPSPKIAEAIVTSLIYLNRHNQYRVVQALILWRPQTVSPELEVILKDFVRTKPLKIWKSTLSRTAQ